MSTSEQRLRANRANALFSTGPSTVEGRAIVSRNATRHGLLSTRLLLEDEDPEEFRALADDLCRSLHPVGIAEGALVERMAITLWRQRRLVQAETASLSLARQPRHIAKNVSSELGRSYSNEVEKDDLAPFDPETERWCRNVVAEIEAVEEIDMRTLELRAPLTYAQFITDAEEEDPDKFAASHDGGLTGYMAELLIWCRKRLDDAAERPYILALSEQARTRRLVLPPDTMELFGRYQTTLDNQLFKLLKALRDAQEWRLKTLEPSSEQSGAIEAEILPAGA